MLVTSKELLLKAQEGGYAVGAFNVENMEMVQAVFSSSRRIKFTSYHADNTIYSKICRP